MNATRPTPFMRRRSGSEFIQCSEWWQLAAWHEYTTVRMHRCAIECEHAQLLLRHMQSNAIDCDDVKLCAKHNVGCI
jgi:hypothetical protein